MALPPCGHGGQQQDQHSSLLAGQQTIGRDVVANGDDNVMVGGNNRGVLPALAIGGGRQLNGGGLLCGALDVGTMMGGGRSATNSSQLL